MRAEWVLSRAAEPAGLAEFLLEREWRCCFYSSRLPSSLQASGTASDVHAILRGPGGLEGAVLLGAEGTIYPVLGETGPAGAAQVARLISRRDLKPARLIGLREDVLAMEAALGIRAAARVEYLLMRRPESAPREPPAPRLPGLEARWATESDHAQLMPLQEAYEVEEVLIPIHTYDGRAVAAGLRASLSSQAVLMACSGEACLAKAQTNARGILWDQLGGIYVRPEWRGRGLGAWLCGLLARRLEEEGRRTCLFVRVGNAPAIAAYRKAGFQADQAFLISYVS
jgi:GNAT superfamily N-acetyltransferase